MWIGSISTILLLLYGLLLLLGGFCQRVPQTWMQLALVHVLTLRWVVRMESFLYCFNLSANCLGVHLRVKEVLVDFMLEGKELAEEDFLI